MDDIAYLLSVQPVVISIILIAVAFAIFTYIFDFVCSLLIPGWFSPHGFNVREKVRRYQNKTK